MISTFYVTHIKNGLHYLAMIVTSSVTYIHKNAIPICESGKYDCFGFFFENVSTSEINFCMLTKLD